MKGKAIGLALGLAVALVATGQAWAEAERPPEPTCGEGQVTEAPAEWVDETLTMIHHDAVTHQEWVPPVTHVEHRHWSWTPWPGRWGSWQPGRCGGWDWLCQERTVVDQEGYWATVVDQEAWDEAVVTPGYWTPPVCRDAVGGCTDPAALNYSGEADVDDGTCEYACPVSELYTMFVLVDDDAPAGYLQGGTCYVIAESFPSVGRQQAICTYPFGGGTGTGWLFDADRAPYAGPVTVDCNGDVHFGWPAWDPAWVRR